MAYTFDGSTQYLAAAAAPASVAPLTISAMVYKTASTNGSIAMIGHSGNVNLSFRLRCVNNAGAQEVHATANSGGSDAGAVATLALPLNGWHQVGAVFASTTSRAAFVDGANKGTNTTSKNPTGLDVTAVGARNQIAVTDHFAGQIGEVAIWNTALSDAEMAALGAGCSPLCLAQRLANLVIYQDLIRPLNRPGIGPAMAATGGPGVAPHPRIVFPWATALGRFRRQFLEFYRVAAATAHASAVVQGWAAAAGVERGATVPMGEVAN